MADVGDLTAYSLAPVKGKMTSNEAVRRQLDYRYFDTEFRLGIDSSTSSVPYTIIKLYIS